MTYIASIYILFLCYLIEVVGGEVLLREVRCSNLDRVTDFPSFLQPSAGAMP